MVLTQRELQVLDRQDCLARLHSVNLGRIALSERALPVILPVSFGVIGHELYFEVGQGLLLRAAEQGHVVCFETDFADVAHGRAWSVLATGPLRLVVDPARAAQVRAMELPTWVSPDHPRHVIELEMALLDGRGTPV